MEQPQTTPMDGASIPAESEPMDQIMGGEDVQPMEDPSMEGASDMGGEDVQPMEDPSMEGASDMEGDDSTMSIINKLNDEDREAVRAYAESMLSKNSEQEPNSEVAPMDDPSMDGEPMMESAIFTKKQLKMIMENFGPTEDELQKVKNDKQLSKKKERTVSKKSPFNSPKFN
jgi:hypothetical protein